MRLDQGTEVYVELLRLFLGQRFEPTPNLLRSATGEIESLLSANLVVRRGSSMLRRAWVDGAEALDALERREANRVSLTLAAIAQLQDFCQRAGVEVVFPKALQHYPDMGHDIDLWTLERASSFDADLCREFGAIPARRGVFDRIAGKRGYELPGCPAPVEIHHEAIGHLGEHRRYLRLVIERRRWREVDGVAVSVPSPEDQLIVQALQRLFSHFSIRISDVLLTVSLVRDVELDWDYARSTSRRFGLSEALSIWLGLVSDLCDPESAAVGARVRRRPDAAMDAVSPKPLHLRMRGKLLRVRVLDLAPRLYGGLLLHSLLRREWRMAGRIAALPAAVAAFGIAGANRQLRTAFSSRVRAR
jgi:hypothetical protein